MTICWAPIDTHAEDNFETGHPLYTKINELASLAKTHPALRNGAHQHRYSSAEAGIYAFSRLHRSNQVEYVVALNNSESEKTAAVPTYVANGAFEKVYGSGPAVPDHQRRPAAVADRAGPLDGGLQVGEAHREVDEGAEDHPQRPEGDTGDQLAGPGDRGSRRHVLQRGDLLRQGRQRRLQVDRDRRHPPIPGLPRRLLDP